MENVKGEVIAASQATIPDFMNYFQVNLMNPKVLVGAFIGGMASFLFCGLTMEAVGRAAQKIECDIDTSRVRAECRIYIACRAAETLTWVKYLI